ncbi:MAG: alpha/beta hydrolase [Lentisphaeria bacterium]|nr:alpha/beta hydrolase [Lentisphaeria bacterium]
MRQSYFILLFLLFASFSAAAAETEKSLTFVSKDIRPIRIWENHTVPLAVPADNDRKETLVKKPDGKRRVKNISVPEIYPFFAPGKGTHPAVIVSPGGGYSYVSWDAGIEVCRWFQRNGFPAFLLKYRCPGRRAAALADIARAIRLIRFRAGEFNIDPERVGAIGFSAGGHLSAAVSASAVKPYQESDAADKLDHRPNFTALIYPAFLVKNLKDLSLNKEFKVDKQTPPTLLIQTGDDPIKVENSLSWYLALRRAGVPCEMHIWAKGGHGYALGQKKEQVSDWPRIALKWFRRNAKMK